MSNIAAKKVETHKDEDIQLIDEKPIPYCEPLKACLDSDSDDSLDDEDDFFYSDEAGILEYERNSFTSQQVPTQKLDGVSDLELKAVMMTAAEEAIKGNDKRENHQFLSVQVDEIRRPRKNPSYVSLDSSISAPLSSSSSLASTTTRSMSTGCIRHDDLSTSKALTVNQKRKRRRVSLNDIVTVFPIPRREEYSEQTKAKLWSSAEELCSNAARNGIEFASEGWNWRNAAEDEQMLLCDNISGERERVHPIHVHNLLVERGLIQESKEPANQLSRQNQEKVFKVP